MTDVPETDKELQTLPASPQVPLSSSKRRVQSTGTLEGTAC